MQKIGRPNAELYRVSARLGCNLTTRIASNAVGNVSNPTLDESRTSIIYLDEGNHTVRTVLTDGTGDRLLFRNPPSCGSVLRLSRNPENESRLIAVCAPSASTTKLFVMTTRGRIIRQLPSAKPFIDDPSISPDGSAVVYWAGASRSPDGGSLYIADMAGTSPPRPFTFQDQGTDADPAWSADNTAIAFRRRAVDGDYNILIKPLDGNEALLVGGSSDDDRPSWSPDGKALVFLSDRHWPGKAGNEIGLFSIDRTGRNLRYLGSSAPIVLAPTWGNR